MQLAKDPPRVHLDIWPNPSTRVHLDICFDAAHSPLLQAAAGQFIAGSLYAAGSTSTCIIAGSLPTLLQPASIHCRPTLQSTCTIAGSESKLQLASAGLAGWFSAAC